MHKPVAGDYGFADSRIQKALSMKLSAFILLICFKQLFEGREANAC